MSDSDQAFPEVQVVPIPSLDGVHITLTLPTYDGPHTFTLSAERDGDGDWAVDFSAPEDHEAENVRVGAAAGTYRLGAPERESDPEVPTSIEFYATSEHGFDDMPWPVPADTWMWQSGDRWVAVVGAWHQDWWEGADQEDIDARPEEYERHILRVPTTGTLIYNDQTGEPVSRKAG